MKRCSTLILLILAFAFSLTVNAQQHRPTPEERERWFAEMRNYKHQFLTENLDLTKEQQAEFFPIYDAMDDELLKLNRETRQLERKIRKSESVSDIEYETAAHALFELGKKESEIRLQYFDKFKGILTPKQLFQLMKVERDFTKNIMQEHHRRRHQH